MSGDRAISSTNRTMDNLESKMQKVSLTVSFVAVFLMLGGFADALVRGMPLSIPGVPVLPLAALIHLTRVPFGLAAMSAGILLLALLPATRVLLALTLYTHRRNVLNTLAASVVLVELLLSVRAGG